MGFLAPIAEAIGGAAGAVGSAAGTAGSALGSAAGTVGSALGGAAGAAGEAIGSGASTVGNAVKDVGSSLMGDSGSASGGFTGSSAPDAPTGLSGYSDPLDKPTSLAQSHPDVVKYGQNIGGNPGAPEKGNWMDTIKKMKSFAPGGGASSINMPNINQIQSGQPQQQGQSPQFSELMKFIEEKQKGGM